MKQVLLPLVQIHKVESKYPELKGVLGALEESGILIIGVIHVLLKYLKNLGKMNKWYRNLMESLEEAQEQGYYAICYNDKQPKALHDYVGFIVCDGEKKMFEYMKIKDGEEGEEEEEEEGDED